MLDENRDKRREIKREKTHRERKRMSERSKRSIVEKSGKKTANAIKICIE